MVTPLNDRSGIVIEKNVLSDIKIKSEPQADSVTMCSSADHDEGRIDCENYKFDGFWYLRGLKELSFLTWEFTILILIK